jgi:hypothetical protein
MPKPSRPQDPSARRSAKSAQAIRRAIQRTNPVKEPPTVGKPVIIDPAEPIEPTSAAKSKRRGQRKDEDDRP